jgi:thymidine kinase
LPTLKTILSAVNFADATYIVIEEAQFFPDLYHIVIEMVEKRGKHVLVFGLDGDSERRPFGQVLDLIPVADKYTKLKAECRFCGDGTAALFTKRFSADTEQVCVGGEETYKAVCRKHYLDPTRV